MHNTLGSNDDWTGDEIMEEIHTIFAGEPQQPKPTKFNR